MESMLNGFAATNPNIGSRYNVWRDGTRRVSSISALQPFDEQEASVAEEKNEAPSGAAEQTIELARKAMENYLDFFQRSMFASPWAQTDLNKKIQSYAGKNLATTFEFAQKLTKAKDLQELVQIQTEFMQTQMKALSEQAQDIGETATNAATSAIKGASASS